MKNSAKKKIQPAKKAAAKPSKRALKKKLYREKFHHHHHKKIHQSAEKKPAVEIVITPAPTQETIKNLLDKGRMRGFLTETEICICSPTSRIMFMITNYFWKLCRTTAFRLWKTREKF